jgi:hypothetical protein
LAAIQAVDTQKYLSPGDPLKVRLNVTVGNKPSNDAIVDYFLSDKEGRVIFSGKAEPLENKTRDEEGSRLNNTRYANGSKMVFAQDRTDIVESVSADINEQGIYEISLNSSVTSKLQEGPNLMKIFANTDDAFRPDIYTIPLLIVGRQLE